MKPLYDYIIIGSGFGGSVSAMRLTEKGYSVLVIEKGKRWRAEDFPKSNRSLHKYLWMPMIRFFGIQQLSFFKEVFVLSGVGVGGGSLVYANTLLEPPDVFYQNSVWSSFKNWKETLAPFYREAKRMLGATPANNHYAEDNILRDIATDMQRENSFYNVNVGVYYGDTKMEKDPYFDGQGPMRKGCIECAGCMVGCRYNAKNTLDKNYLFFAEKQGAEILPETVVTKIEYDDATQSYIITTQSSTSFIGHKTTTYRSKGLVVSGGVLGTQELLLKQKYQYKTLPRLSDTLGHNLRTNSESICGVIDGNQKLNHGIAISSGFHPTDDTHIEIVKFPDRSDAMLRLATLATGDGAWPSRIIKLMGNILTKPKQFIRSFFATNPASNGIILLVMQTLDNKMKMVLKRGLFGYNMKMDNSENKDKKVPVYIPTGQEVMHRYADKVSGVPLNAATEIFFNMSTTAHILGGCPMGSTSATGVVNEYFQAFGYPNMYILDGSIIPCNLGVNPSLTITALSEYAMSHIAAKDHNE